MDQSAVGCNSMTLCIVCDKIPIGFTVFLKLDLLKKFGMQIMILLELR